MEIQRRYVTFRKSHSIWQTPAFRLIKMHYSLTEVKRELLLHALTNISHSCWRRQWHPTPVLLPGKSHGRRSLVGAVHGVAKSRTWLSAFTCTFPFHALEKEMATHSSVLAWRIPGMAEPGGLLSMGSHRVGHDWSNLAAAAAVRAAVHVETEP